MKELEIFGANRSDPFTKTRSGSRAVVIKDGKILLAHETASDYWQLPGGGFEKNESPEDCCIREVEEETGYLVLPVRKFLILSEYYDDIRYVSHYFVCEITGRGKRNPTETEKSRGLEPQWLSLQKAIDVFSRHQDYANVNEDKRGTYLREYTALENLQL